MQALFFFEAMLTPKIITFVYWLLLLSVVIGSFGYMFGGYGGFSFGKFIAGLGIFIGGGIGVRIWCELLIVLFKINENIKHLAER